MTFNKKNCALIVCSDDRCKDIATVLKGFNVYFRVYHDHEWQYSKFYNNRDKLIPENKAPKKFDVLFFHRGSRDPNGIPEHANFEKEFVFSGPGVHVSQKYAGRDAIPIQRPFPNGACPIKARHLPELIEFLNGVRTEIPTFCRSDETVPSLWALAITFQAYASAGIACGEITEDSELITTCSLDKEQIKTVKALSGQLVEFWPRMQTKKWWRGSLGILDSSGNDIDEYKYRKFFARLILDLEKDDKAREVLDLPENSDLAESEIDALRRFLDQQTEVKRVMEFLGAPQVDIKLLTAACSEVKDLLVQR